MTALQARYSLRQPAGAPPVVRHAGLTSDDVEWLLTPPHLTLALQPVVCLATREIDHQEALLRLRPPPGLPSVPARLFVAAAEAFGLAPALDAAVLAAAPRAGSVSVNICAASLQAPGFVAALLAGGHPKPAIELTGAEAIADLPAVAAAVAALRAAGVTVALDALDGEPASLALAAAARFDRFKLAGSVVRAAASGGRGRSLLAALLRLAAATGAATIATQIETLPQAWAMQQAGVAFGQGWLFGAPSLAPQCARAPSRSPSHDCAAG